MHTKGHVTRPDGDGCRGDCGKEEICGDGLPDAGEECDDGNSNPNDACSQCEEVSWTAEVLIGLGEDAGDPTQTELLAPAGAAVDLHGNIFVSDALRHLVYRVDAISGDIIVVAGTGDAGTAGDARAALRLHGLIAAG